MHLLEHVRLLMAIHLVCVCVGGAGGRVLQITTKAGSFNNKFKQNAIKGNIKFMGNKSSQKN